MKRVIIVAGSPFPALDNLIISSEDCVIGVDRGAYKLAKRGIIMHHAFGDFDSVSSQEFKMIQSMSQQIHCFPSEKDDTDFQLALQFSLLNYTECHSIEIYGILGGKGRIDHFISNVWLAYDVRFQPFLEKMKFIEEDCETIFLLPGKHAIENTLGYHYLSIVTHTPEMHLTIKGAKYELERKLLKAPCALISNEFLPEIPTVYVEFDTGIVSIWHVKSEKQRKNTKYV